MAFLHTFCDNHRVCYGNLGQYNVLYVLYWLRALGNAWEALGNSRRLWGALGCSGEFWGAPEMFGRLWGALGGLGKLWEALGSSGELWEALGISWISMKVKA